MLPVVTKTKILQPDDRPKYDQEDRLFIGDEAHGDGVNTMACVFCGKSLAGEDVSEMCAAMVADNFHTHPVGIRDPFYGAFNFVVEAWPPAM